MRSFRRQEDMSSRHTEPPAGSKNPTTRANRPNHTIGLREMVAEHSTGSRHRGGHFALADEYEHREPDTKLVALEEPDDLVSEASKDGIASLIRRANHDELTGLANRNWFVTAIERERADASGSSALFLIDLDGFKAVNDTWGHGAGDTVLAEVGTRLNSMLNGRSHAARFGGDEFAFWVAECTDTEALLLAERIVASVSEPIPGDLGLSVGASVGWVKVSDSSPIHALLSRADIALYAVKERGGHGHQMFDRTLAAARVEGRVLQREIREAMESAQFVVAQQAIATIDGRTVGHEMLARWQHPRRGVLGPSDFLPAVHASGKCAAFDEYMMERVVSIMSADPASGRPAHSTWLNLTEYSLTEATLDLVQLAASEGRIAPEELVIEVSENSRSESSEAVRILEEMAELGVGIAIDDFGAGYSRLSAMSRLPVSYVKIDRQFIDGLAQDDGRIEIVRAVINLIAAIGAESVAEGVETEEDRSVLADLGCDYMQGFLLHRPELVS